MTTNNRQSRERIARQLKTTRKDRKLSLGKLSKELRIPESTLGALENPRDTSIPGSHLPGLTRRYAEHLGLAAGDIDSMLAELGSQKTSLKRRQSKARVKPIVFSRIVAALAAGIVLLIVAGYALLQVYGLASAPSLHLDEPAADSVVYTPEIAVSGTAGADSSVLVNGDPVILDDNGRFAVTVYVQSGRNYLDVSAINSFSRQTTVTRTLYYQQP